jgi:hypothetical protein
MKPVEKWQKRIALEIKKNFFLHPLIESEPEPKNLIYATVLYRLASEAADVFFLNNAVALELMALSFRKHFLKKADALDIIKGDFFYARALKYTMATGFSEAVQILAQTVVNQAVFEKYGFRSEPFLSLLEASARLSLLKTKGRIFSSDSPEVLTKLEQILPYI